MQVRALYDFAAHPGSGELALKAGDILTVTKQDVGDGWWEGVNAEGMHGLFPETYVEMIAGGGPPAMPPPPLPDNVARRQQSIQSSTFQQQISGDSSTAEPFCDAADAPANLRMLSTSSSQKPSQRVSVGGDEFDDDFSRSDDESTTEQRNTFGKSTFQDGRSTDNGDAQRGKRYLEEPAYGCTLLPPHTPSPDTATEHDEFEERCHSAEPSENMLDVGRPITTGGSVKKSINRFSKFVQSGMEAFILNQAKMAAPSQQELFEVSLSNAGPKWAVSAQHQHTCRLGSYKKESKMKGLKSFINYELAPSFAPNTNVERRYKHFEWLLSRLESKFAFTLLPPLPERQVSGRSDEDLEEHRMQLLQMWIDKICRHPVLSRAEVWTHFLVTPPEGKEWKNMKKKVEKDPYVGGNFYFSVTTPAQPLDASTVEQRFDVFDRKAKSLVDSIRCASATASDSIKYICGPFRAEFAKYSTAFRSLGQAMSDETGSNATAGQLANALRSTGDKYDNIAKMCSDQPKVDLEPLLDHLFAYRGVLSAIPPIVKTEKNILARLREHQKLAEDGKMAPAELEAIRGRVDTVSYAMLAEVNHFEQEHVRDMKTLAKNFLLAQVNFFDNIRKELQDAVQLFS